MFIDKAIRKYLLQWIVGLIVIWAALIPIKASAERAQPGSEILNVSASYGVYAFRCDQSFGNGYMITSVVHHSADSGSGVSVSCARLYSNQGRKVALVGLVTTKSFTDGSSFSCGAGSALVGLDARANTFSCRKFTTVSNAGDAAERSSGAHGYQSESILGTSQVLSTCNDGYAVGGTMQGTGVMRLSCEYRPNSNIGGTLRATEGEHLGADINCNASALPNASIKVRIHRFDEEGPTIYLCSRWYQHDKMLILTGAVQQHGPFTERNSNVNCADNQVMISRRHSGDEKGNTTIGCQGYQDSQFQQPITVTNPYTIEQKEAFSWMDCGQGVFTGRKHNGDENGQTTVTCRELY